MTATLPYSLSYFNNLDTIQSVPISMVVIALLFILIVEKEFIRAYGTMNIRVWLNAINNYSWTLLGVFAFLIVMRLISFVK